MKKWTTLAFLLAMFTLAACSEQPNPEQTFTAYVDAWENQEYETMYGLLSEQAQNTITEEEFIDRYTNIYDGIGMENLTITYSLPEEEQEYDQEEAQTFPFDVSMDSMAGEISFSNETELVYEEVEEEDPTWSINWKTSMIFPEMTDQDTVRASTLPSTRGEIFDANGNGLAINGVIQEVGLVPEWITENEAELKQGLAEILNTSVESIDEQLNQSWVQPGSFVPVGRVSDNDTERIDAIKELPSGWSFNETTARVYPLDEAAAHLTGYVGSISAEELEERQGEGYSATSILGKTGLERVLEDQLRGTPGVKVSILGSNGQEKEVLAQSDPVNGENVNLTIDSTIQETIFNEMNGEKGTASAINPTTGEVKALVSSPSYDPNDAILGRLPYTELSENPDAPLRNRFRATYSPGSTFKPITAAIGLESGAIDPAEELTIEGRSYSQEGWGGYSVTRVEGAAVDSQVNLRDALVRSDNIYFARSILEIGGETFLEEAEAFGFGQDMELAYPIENSQILNEAPFSSEALLADTGYGQGQVQMSALHLAATYTPFVTDGTLLKPVLLAEGETAQTWHEGVITPETAATIRESLSAVVSDPEGTANDASGLPLAGKTGTAELKQSLEEENGQINGWFIAWNTDSRDLMVSMMLEDAENGSSDVVPKVRNVFETVQ
ncbi:penicillin-binding transpeptidase domain-containing protein [Halobacillus fulvus]|nr:penicillin-binding transpeptidase domain-containing protein [Halobacillus fulvus]